MILGWCSSRKYLTSRTADMSRPSLNWPTLIFLMAILRPVASSRPGACACSPRQPSQKRDEGGTTKKPTSIHDCIRSLSDFLILHPFGSCAPSSRQWWGILFVRGERGRDTYHLFCRSALALSTASMERVMKTADP